MEEKTSIFTRPVNELLKEKMKENERLVVKDARPLAEFPDDITEEELRENTEALLKGE